MGLSAEIPTYEWDYKVGGKNADGKVEVTLALPARPKRLELNPDHAILAKVKKR